MAESFLNDWKELEKEFVQLEVSSDDLFTFESAFLVSAGKSFSVLLSVLIHSHYPSTFSLGYVTGVIG